MKLKAAPKHFAVEMTPGEAALPPMSVPELALKRILVPLDFSESSRRALRYAESFARQFNAELLLLHVVEPVPPPPPDYIINDSFADNNSLREAAQKRMAECRAEMNPCVPNRALIQLGGAWQEIVRAADDNNVDLIVIGNRGRPALAHFLMGSTAERVVQHAHCPVMVIREREHDFLEESAPAKSSARG